MILLWAMMTALAPEEITVREYRERLVAIRAGMEQGNLAEIRNRAGDLLSCRIRYGEGTVPPDAALLRPLSEAPGTAEARTMSARLSGLIDALDAGSEAPREPDKELLDRLRREEALGEIRAGGDLRYPRKPEIPKSIMERLGEIGEWIVEKLDKIIRWLWDLFFGGRSEAGGSGSRPFVIVLIISLLAIFAAVTAVVLRRKRQGAKPAVTSSTPAMSAKDEDPLSRTASEWERFAAELMSAGRYREVIRAWYNAVLVALFRAGLAHYRKGRTNWEYAYALTPDLPWRPGFMEATRRFEQEWYGRRDTAEETAREYMRQAQGILIDVRDRQGAMA